MTPNEQIERARRAKLALDEFLAPALDEIEQDYAEKMIASAASVDPRAPEVIVRLANGIKVARQVRMLIESHIAEGKIAENAKTRAEREAEMTPTQRRLLKIGAV